MNSIAFILTSLLCIPIVVIAESLLLPKNSIQLAKSIFACKLNVHEEVKYCNTNSPEDYGCICSNKDAIMEFVGCYAYSQKDPHEAIDFFVEFCQEYGNTTVDMDSIYTAYENYTAKGYYNVSITSPNHHNYSNNSNVFEPNLPKEKMVNYTNSLKLAIDQYLVNWDNTFYYGAGILGYWALVILIAAISNWTRALFPGLMTDLTGPLSNWWRQNISLPATFGSKKSQSSTLYRFLDFYIPSRFESIVITGFVIVCIITLSINTYFAQGDELIHSSYDARLRYVANRTGTNSTMMLPLVILFAGRNNILQFITGWNYTTFLTFHRHIARMMFAFVVIHAGCFTIALGSSYGPVMKLPFMIWGTAATVIAGLMLFQGMLYLRRKWYEVFLIGHIILAIFFIIGTWIHVVDFGYMWYIYAAIAFWGFDRFIRVARLLCFGFQLATITLLPGETMRVVISKPKDWVASPGSYVFVSFFTPKYFWQSHPFTISTSTESTITLYCKVKEGVTQALYKDLLNSPNKTIKIRAGVEGPYGELSGAKTAESAVFVAGGNGMPGMYSEATHLASRRSIRSSKKIKLYWIVRDYRLVQWYYEELQLLQRTNIETVVYVTRPNDSLEEVASNFTSSNFDEKSCYSLGDFKTMISCNSKYTLNLKKDNNNNNNYHHVKELIKDELSHILFVEGRPNLQKMVEQELEEAGRSIAFVTCGHPAMVDELRCQVIKVINNPEKKRVDFYDQLQGWS